MKAEGFRKKLFLFGRIFLFNGKTELAYALAERIIFPVRVGGEVRAVDAKLAFLHHLLVYVDGADVGDEHIVRAKRHDVRYLADKGNGAFLYYRAGGVFNVFGR